MISKNDSKKRKRKCLAWILCTAITLESLLIPENKEILVYAEENSVDVSTTIESEEILLLEEETELDVILNVEENLTEEDNDNNDASLPTESETLSTPDENLESIASSENLETDSSSNETSDETQTQENIAEGVYRNITWVIDADGKLTVNGSGEIGASDGPISLYSRAPWYSKKYYIKSAEINVTGVKDASYMFFECKNLVSVDLSRFDTYNVTNMFDMFYGCESLTSVDLSDCDMSHVTDMRGMFRGCWRLTKLDFSDCDLKCVADMEYMFAECSNLAVLYAPRGCKVTCYLPTSVDGWYDVDGNTYTSFPRELDHSIILSKNALPDALDAKLTVSLHKKLYRKGSKIKPEDLTVKFCNPDGRIVTLSLKGVSGNGYTLSDVDMNTLGEKTLTVSYNDGTQTHSIALDFTVVESFPIIASGKYENITWSIDEDGKLLVEGTGEFSEALGKGRAPWYSNRYFIKSAEINVTGMKNASYMFEECSLLRDLDLSGLDTSCVTDMNHMFFRCNSLINLDLHSFNTSCVTDMSYMFGGCGRLNKLDLHSFDTSRVTDMNHMFGGDEMLVFHEDKGYSFLLSNTCYSLTSLDLHSFDTSRVTDMNCMFSGCSSLTALDLRSFDTSCVTDMFAMFGGCSSLTRLDLTSFDTHCVTCMSAMFVECSSLTGLDLTSFDTYCVADMECMFGGCSSLTALDLTSFDTHCVELMGYMFDGCSSLTALDLTSFDTHCVADMECMFGGCSNLTELDLTSFDTCYVTGMAYMFDGCSSLTGLDLSSFDMHCITYPKYITDLFNGCNSLNTIYIPYGIKENSDVLLPVSQNSDVWYDINGNTYTKLPEELDYSIVLAKNALPKASTSKLTASLIKTSYKKGSQINPEDLKVSYRNTDGKTVTLSPKGTSENGYTLSNVNMNTVGEKTLIVSYYDGTKTLTQSITFTVVAESAEPTEPDETEESSSEFESTNESSSISETESSTESNSESESSTESSETESSSETSDSTGLRVTFPYGRTYTYTGNSIEPIIKVTNNGKTLTEDTDYTIKYSNNIKAGTAKLTVTGKGCFSGKQDTTFTIQPKSLQDNDITAKDITLVINSKAAPIVVYNGVKLGTKDYTLSNTGKITENGILTITGKGNYKDSVTININVVEALSKFKVNMAKDKLTYNGNEQRLGFEVIDSKTKKPLKEDEYMALYSKDVTNAGIVKVTIIGLGTYTGSVTKSYKIAPAKENMTLEFNKTKKYTFRHSGVTVDDIKVKNAQGTILKNGKDYKVSYAASKAGTGKINVSFLGNYKGSKTIKDTFTITPAVLDNNSVDVIIPDKVYTGKKSTYKSVPIVTDKFGNSLKNSDYTVTYYADSDMTKEINNKENLIELAEKENAAVIYVKVIGKGNYAGNTNSYAQSEYHVKRTTTNTFDISKAKITFKNGNTTIKKLEYTGLPLKPNVEVLIKVKGGNFITLNESQYNIKWTGNLNKGKATAVITGNGTEVNGYAFVGSKNVSISITAGNVNSVKNLFEK